MALLTRKDVAEHVSRMGNHELRNYIVPGLSSLMLGHESRNFGSVRMFIADRIQHSDITPHSHRFDFMCYVAKGSVGHRVWRKAKDHEEGDYYVCCEMRYEHAPGKYTTLPPLSPETLPGTMWVFDDEVYDEGEWYGLNADDIHSIVFEKGSHVLFFEGPTRHDHSYVLLPYYNGQIVNTLTTSDWMFQRIEDY